MDISYFLNILWNRKWLILAVMLLTAIATYFIVDSLPAKYKSNAIISTGIIEFKGVNIDQENLYIQNFQVQNAFSNLIESISGRSTLQLLTKKMVKHDLRGDSLSPPFRIINEKDFNYSSDALNILADSLDLEGKTPLEILNQRFSPELTRLLKGVAKSLDYDYETLRKELEIKRIGETDYLNIEYSSEKPELSYTLVNTFINDIIKLDRSIQSGEESSAYDFYEELVAEKKKSYDQLSSDLNRYKKNNNVVNLEEQTKSIVSQIKELELIRERYKKEIPSLKQNIRDLDAYIKRTARINADDYSNTVLLNGDVEEVSSQISKYTEQYISNGSKDQNLKNKIDRLKKKRSKLIDRMASNEVIDTDDNNDQNKKLLEKRIDSQLELATAEESVKSLDRAIRKLEKNSTGLVSDEAYVSNLEQQLRIVEKEYFDVIDKFHAIEQVSKKEVSRLSVIEPALMPEKPESSKKALLAAFAGITSGILAILAIFVMAFFDTNPNTSSKYKALTKLPVLGTLPHLKKKQLNLSTIFNLHNQDKAVVAFLEAMRKIRYNVETSGSNTILITSNKKQEGKSFFTLALAYSLSLTNRRILVIDGNFRNNVISQYATLPIDESPFYNGQELSVEQKKKPSFALGSGAFPGNIDVMANHGGFQSPTEAMAGKDFVKILHDYSQLYDYVLIEGGAMNEYADAREFALFTNGVIGVSRANMPLKDVDKDSLSFISGLGDKYLGTVLNDMNDKV